MMTARTNKYYNFEKYNLDEGEDIPADIKDRIML